MYNKINNEEKEKKKNKDENKETVIEYVEKSRRKSFWNKNKTAIIIIICILGSLLVLGISIARSNLFSDFKEFVESKSKEKVELKHTDSLTVKSDGVYITDVSEVVDEVMPSVVAITSKTIISSGNFGPFFGGNNSYTTEGAGSGVIIAEDDDEIFILTNYHVVENTTELSVQFIDDNSHDATIKGISERKDIAVVSVSKKNIKTETLEKIKIATVGKSDELKVGNGIIAIGNALGYGQSVTTGVVSALNREVSTDSYVQEMIQIDASINGGNSGGALLNSKGEVVGINTLKYSSNSSGSSASVEGMGFAIPISDVEDIIETLINGQNDVGGLSLGIEGYMTNSNGMSNYGFPTGFYVSSIVEGGNADKSELEIGNIITEIDGKNVTAIESIRKVLNNKDAGDSVTLKVKYVSGKTYKEKEIKITLN